MIINLVHLNLHYMAWGTLRHAGAICVVVHHFSKAHNSNLAIPRPVAMIKLETPTNAPHPRGKISIFLDLDSDGAMIFSLGMQPLTE